MEVVVVSNNYPSSSQPNKGAFVYNLVQELSEQECEVKVICPIKLHDYLKQVFLFKKKKSYGFERCKVYRPLYISLGNKRIFGLNFEKISFLSMKLCVLLCFYLKVKTCDVLYAHFLINAMTVLSVCKNKKIPLVIASGESKYLSVKLWNKSKLSELICSTQHFIAVSDYNKKELLRFGASDEKITIVPNAVNYEVFNVKDKMMCREKYSLGNEKFIVGFIGHFINRKGPNRLIEAVSRLNDSNIEVVCIGNGEIDKREFVTIFPPMANSELPYIINTFDIFVLPTLAEGHCNVIEEVKSCAVPIISSRETSVEKQLDYKTGILIDPLNIDEISKNIKLLKDKFELRKMYRDNLLMKRGEWSMKDRAAKIKQIIKIEK